MSSTSDRLLEPIQRTPLIELVIGRLRELLDSGRSQPGDRLPSERALGDDLRVGRSTIREALRTLEALGLIEFRQGRGAFMPTLEGEREQGASSADWPRSYQWRIADVIETRVAIEPVAAALAARRRTSRDLEMISASLDAFREAAAKGDLSALVLADASFHEAIAESGNPVMASLLKSMRGYLIRSRHTSLGQRERWEAVTQRHEAIYAAIEAGDAGSASRSMASHLVEFARELGVKVCNPTENASTGSTEATVWTRRSNPCHFHFLFT